MTEVIAEIGWNHMGNMNLAKKMIEEASSAGASFAKFQTWSVDRLKPGEWDNDGRREIYIKAELTREKHVELIDYCKEIGIKFLSSVFSVKDAELLASLEIKEVKIPSFESRDYKLIEYCNEHFENIYMSTGTSTFDEIKYSVSLVDKAVLTLLHCVSAYPCKAENANITKIKKLRELCDNIGYSDHISGVESAKVAMKYDINVVEKHFTVDKGLPGRDNKFAILPEEMKNLRNFIDLYDKMHIDLGANYLSIEANSRLNYTGRFNGQS